MEEISKDRDRDAIKIPRPEIVVDGAGKSVEIPEKNGPFVCKIRVTCEKDEWPEAMDFDYLVGFESWEHFEEDFDDLTMHPEFMNFVYSKHGSVDVCNFLSLSDGNIDNKAAEITIKRNRTVYDLVSATVTVKTVEGVLEEKTALSHRPASPGVE